MRLTVTAIVALALAIPVGGFVLAYHQTQIWQSQADREWGPTYHLTVLSVGPKLAGYGPDGPQRLDRIKLTLKGQSRTLWRPAFADYRVGDQDNVRINHKGEMTFADSVGYLPPVVMGLLLAGFIGFIELVLLFSWEVEKEQKRRSRRRLAAV